MKYLGREIEIEIDGIDWRDYPDFCDAYISGAWFTDTGEALTEEQMEKLEEELEGEMNELVHKHIS